MKQISYRGYVIEAYEGLHPAGGDGYTVSVEIFDRSKNPASDVSIHSLSAPWKIRLRKADALEYGITMGRKWVDGLLRSASKS
jgi:hypothetical protein